MEYWEAARKDKIMHFALTIIENGGSHIKKNKSEGEGSVLDDSCSSGI